MRVVRTFAGVLLLTVGLAVLLVGSALWMVAEQRGTGDAFGASLERVETPGRAIVVPDLDALLRRDAPFTRTAGTRLRISAGTDERPAFLGLAPTVETGRYLASMPYAQIERVRVTRGRLPVQVTSVPRTGALAAAVATPGEQAFWVRQGAGTLDLSPADLRGQRLSLVVMYPDARTGVALDLRTELRVGWIEPTTWGVLAGGTLFALLGVAILVWPTRPREVVFVVEPSQLPLLSARLGVRALDDLGQPTPGTRKPLRSRTSAGAVPAVPATEAVPPGWPLHANLPTSSPPRSTRPATLADLLAQPQPNSSQTGKPTGDAVTLRATAAVVPAPVERPRADPDGVPADTAYPTASAHDAAVGHAVPAEAARPAAAETHAEPVDDDGGQAGRAPAEEPARSGVARASSGVARAENNLARAWPASKPPPAKLALNWPPRAADKAAPVSRQSVNRAPVHPGTAAQGRPGPTDPATIEPTRTEQGDAVPTPTEPSPVLDPAPALDPVHPTQPIAATNVAGRAATTGRPRKCKPGSPEADGAEADGAEASAGTGRVPG
ncbi:hypothetical protein ACIBF5_06940 [Micromonospora sp. NPDC050417]|uniref:hypothetical protein n=1 Tax=Micromonospora sp. NPDC050417 TaxID=3364280 RepID=UPI00378C1C9D